MSIVIFDLDGTVIDSSHRHVSKPDGSVDLEHWRENSTAEKIAADSLLPLARSMRRIHAAGRHVIISTARVMSEHDIAYLEANNLPYHALLSRAEGDCRPDADMKLDMVTSYVQAQGYKNLTAANCVMFDDNLKVLAKMAQHGVVCVNATKENRRLVA